MLQLSQYLASRPVPEVTLVNPLEEETLETILENSAAINTEAVIKG